MSSCAAQGSKAVAALMSPTSPFLGPRGRPTLVRAELYHYDFTTADWGRPRPGLKGTVPPQLHGYPDTPTGGESVPRGLQGKAHPALH